MRKMSIYFQLILFVFIIKSISSNNLVSEIKELLKGNNSSKSLANDFINNNKDGLDNISNNLLFLYNNNFGIKYLLNKIEDKDNINENEFTKLNRYLSEKLYINKNSINTTIFDDIESIPINSSILTPFQSLLKNISNISKFDLYGFINKLLLNNPKNINNINNIINLLQNKEFHIKFIKRILENISAGTLNKFILEESKNLLKDCDPNFINNLVNILYSFIKDNKLQKYFSSFFFEEEIDRMNISDKFKNHNISEECFLLFNKTLLGYDEKANISDVHFYRGKFMDANKDKNEFFNYEKCIETDNYKSNYLNSKPVLVLSIIDATKKIENSKNNTLYEKYYFSIITCLPQGFNKNNEYVCTEGDYNKIIKVSFESIVYRKIMNVSSSDLKIKSFIIMKEEKLKYTNIELVSIIFASILIIIPIIINLYLWFFKKIKIKNANINKGKIIKKLEKDKENEENEDEEEDEEIIKEQKKVAFPKRIILLNYFFDLKENLKELFNIKSNLNINNMNGLNYIKGLIGI